MLTFIGACLIVVACVWAGYRGAANLAAHRYRLLGAEQGLRALIREIAYLSTPLAQALSAAAPLAGAAESLFRSAAEKLRQADGLSGEEAWLAALASQEEQWSQEERAALTVVAGGLGKTESTLQVQHLELAAQRILVCEQEAAEKETRFGKIWRSMGWAAGAVLVLLLW